MPADMIISYDGTANDDDAIALGKLLALNGTKVALAFVRHAPEIDPQRESLAQHDAESKLERGAELLGDAAIPRHIVFSAATGVGLEELAKSEGASLIVFGSDYRTPPGHAEPPTSAQQLLEIGTVGIAIAAAGLRAEDASITKVAVAAAEPGDAAELTAEALASKLGAELIGASAAGAELIVVGSQTGAPQGRLALSGSARALLDASRASVIVVPSGTPLLV